MENAQGQSASSSETQAVSVSGGEGTKSQEVQQRGKLQNQLVSALEEQLGGSEADGEELEASGPEEQSPENDPEDLEASGEEETPDPRKVAEEAQPQKSRAHERTQKLVNERNELKQILAQSQQQQMQLQQQNLQFQQQLAQAMQQMAAVEQGKVREKQLMAHKARLAELENDPRAKFEYEMLQRAKKAVAPEIQQLRQQIQQERQQRDHALNQAKHTMAVRKLATDVQTQVETEFFAKVPGLKKSQYLPHLNRLTDMAMTYGAAYRVPPQQAVQETLKLIKDLQGYNQQASMQQRTPEMKRAAQVAAPVPGPTSKGKTEQVTTKWPSLAAVKSKGFHSHIDWIEAGKPPV
jgi:hypothetical protein